MSTRLPAFIIGSVAALALLSGCGGEAALPPLDEAALAAVDRRPGVPREKLARAIDDLFANDEAGETRAVVVIASGRIVAERYAPGFDRDTRFIGWSMAKTVTGLMIGLLVSDGLLRLDESAPVPSWQRSGDARGEITLRQLLQMRSGLRHAEAVKPVYSADEVRMLFLDGRDAMAAHAEAQPLEAEPGAVFEYSSATSLILADIAARTLTDSADPALRRRIVADYLRARLWEPLGMRSAVPEFDAAGTFIGSSMVHATARDWGKLGEFLRTGGAVKGAQVLPRGWIEFMTRPSPRNPGYGAQVWLNRPQAGSKAVLIPGGLASLLACVGHLGQYVVVSPAQRLTVVRLGHSKSEQREAVRAHLGQIVSLFPRR